MELRYAAGTGVLIAGVDEAGRGPLAGPVVAAAVILPLDGVIEGIGDSKQLNAAERSRLAVEIKARSAAWGIGCADHTEIDAVNILQATLLAMQRAVTTLTVRPDRVLVDGNQAPVLECGVETIIKGDQLIPAIGAASILAKVARDEEMTAYDSRFPGYGFARHKGYPTAGHLQALARLGPCPIHRKSFAPVKKLLGARYTRLHNKIQTG